MVKVDELESKRRVATMLARNGRTDPTPNFVVARGRGVSLDSRVPAALLANARSRTLPPMVNHWHRLLSKQVMTSVRKQHQVTINTKNVMGRNKTRMHLVCTGN